MSVQQARLLDAPMAGVYPTAIEEANFFLLKWGHKLGPVHRPFRQEAYALELLGRVVAVATSGSIVMHRGDIYRFDGWEKVKGDCGSSGGGSWSRKRYATDAVHGKKTLWVYRFEAADVTGAADA